jgi:hypothetical protein
MLLDTQSRRGSMTLMELPAASVVSPMRMPMIAVGFISVLMDQIQRASQPAQPVIVASLVRNIALDTASASVK